MTTTDDEDALTRCADGRNAEPETTRRPEGIIPPCAPELRTEPMTAGWCVRVSVFDDLVVSISERELAGRDLSEADQNLIRDCAQHLLSFVGSVRCGEDDWSTR